jgi:hypothetical protein
MPLFTKFKKAKDAADEHKKTTAIEQAKPPAPPYRPLSDRKSYRPELQRRGRNELLPGNLRCPRVTQSIILASRRGRHPGRAVPPTSCHTQVLQVSRAEDVVLKVSTRSWDTHDRPRRGKASQRQMYHYKSARRMARFSVVLLRPTFHSKSKIIFHQEKESVVKRLGRRR